MIDQDTFMKEVECLERGVDSFHKHLKEWWLVICIAHASATVINCMGALKDVKQN